MYLAMLLIYSGLTHMSQPYFFAFSVSSYRIIPTSIMSVIVPLMISFSLCVGGSLVMGNCPRLALFLAFCLFTTFASAQIWALIQNYKISCGCFGDSDSRVSVWSAAVPISASLLALIGMRVAFFCNVPACAVSTHSNDSMSNYP